MFDSVLNMSWVLNLPGSEYAKVLNISFLKYKKVLFPEN